MRRQTAPTFGLAPMEGVSELAFRLWLSQTSAPAFMGTPFLRATDTYPKAIPRDFAPELDRFREHVSYQLIPQIMAAQPEDFVRTAQLCLDSAPFVDLNAGCPSPNPISGGAGSGLLKDPARFGEFMRKIADRLPAGRFSLKMRTGFEDTEHFFTYLSALQEVPLARLTVHGRTRRDRYDGQSRWDLIAAAANFLHVPVSASGDIISWESWLARAQYAEAIQQVIVGRGALRNPWIFLELRGHAPQAFRLPMLELAMACLGLLLEAQQQQNPRLDELVLTGCFLSCCAYEEAAWSELYSRLVRTLRGQSIALAELNFERVIMGRLKMLWNSLRSSLPEAFFEPTLLRASAFPEWVGAWRLFWGPERSLQIKHRPDLDWLYTSSRQKGPIAP